MVLKVPTVSLRQPQVITNGAYSSWSTMLLGVLQGSVLGPILFLIYVNDLPVYVSRSKIAMFANDTKCFKVIPNQDDISNLKKDIYCISHWALGNELFLKASEMRKPSCFTKAPLYREILHS